MIRLTENCTNCGTLRVIPTSLPARVVLYGGPEPGVKVELPADGGVTPVQHSAEGIPPGTYQLEVSAEGKVPTTADVEIRSGELAEIRVDALPAAPPPSERDRCVAPKVWERDACRDPAPVAGSTPGWYWYVLGGAAALGLVGAGLYYAGSDPDPEDNPRRKRSRRR